MERIGVYGYECSVEMSFDNFNLIPVNNNFSEVKKLASDNDTYHLTAILEVSGSHKLRDLVFDLEAVLSFIDHRDVLIRNVLHKSEEFNNLEADFPLKINAHKRRSGGSSNIISDVFNKESRHSFIHLAMNKLSDSEDPENKVFRSAFFKTVEVFRGRECFIDISYYLRFSALESLARVIYNDYTSRTCATPIAKLLIEYGFDIKQENLKEPYKSVTTYVELRNALFHNGSFEVTVKRNGNQLVYKLSEYSSVFSRLILLVMIKYIGFDDGSINWNSWLDRIAFK